MKTTDQSTLNDSNEKVEKTSNDSKQNQEYNWIDDCFRVYKTRFGLWYSVNKDGKNIITALSEEACVRATRFYLKGLQEGWTEETSRVVNDGVVGGKL